MSESTNNPRPQMNSRLAVLEVLTPGVELTDAELVARIPHLHRGKVIPARIALAKKGEVELVGKNEGGINVWRLTPPGHQEAARDAARARRLTEEARIAALKPERQAQVIAALLENGEVNRLLREQAERGLAMRRARARAQDSHTESEAERRERKRELREEERRNGPNLEFLKVRDAVRDSVSALLGIRSFLRDELGRLDAGEPMRIPPERWQAAMVNVVEVLHVAGAIWQDMGTASGAVPEHCPLCGARTARDPHALEQGYFDADAEEILE